MCLSCGRDKSKYVEENTFRACMCLKDLAEQISDIIRIFQWGTLLYLEEAIEILIFSVMHILL